MPFILPDPIREKRLSEIQKNLREHKEEGHINCLGSAVSLMLQEPSFQRQIAASPKLRERATGEVSLMNLAWGFLLHQLMSGDVVAAAMTLYDEETFTAKPRCTQLVWDALMTKRMIIIIGGGGLGKCLGPEVRVLLFNGETKAAKDVVVGDVLMGDDSTPRNVLKANVGHGPMYRIIPERGEPWTCNGDHILTLKCSYDKKCGNGAVSTKRAKGMVVDVPLNEYLKWGSSKKEGFLAYHVPADFKEQPLPYDPYIYGAWLGDGGWDTPAIHKPFGPITERWSQYFTSIGMRVSVGYENTPCPMICARTVERGPNPFTQFIRTSVRNKEKFIRDDYLRNSRENRMQLLAGLLDTDGYASGSSFELSSKWEGLARQVMWLARSLGFAATVSSKIATIASIGFSATYWRVHISGTGISLIPTLQKHASEPTGKKNAVLTRFKVEPIGDGDFHGFVIDGNRRFLLGDFTVTHNTYSPSAYFLLQWILDPSWTRFQVASASKDHLYKNLYGDIVRLHGGASMKLPGTPDTESISLNKKVAQGIFTLILPGGPQSRGKIKGSHTKPRPMHPLFGRRSRVFCLVDEAQETPQNIFEETTNRFSTVVGDDVEHLKFVFSANPKDVFSKFGATAKPARGWDSIRESDETWESESGWTVISLDGMQHENVVQKRVVYPGFITWEGVQLWLKKCGGNANDPIFWTYVRGKFPPAGLASCIIKQSWLLASQGEWVFDDRTVGKAGADPAYVGDRPALACGRVGRAIGWIDYDGNRHMLPVPKMAIQVDAVTVVERGDSQDLADRYMEPLKPLGVQPDGFGIDMTGAGRGTHDLIRRQWAQKVGPIPGGDLVATIHGIEYGSSPTLIKIAQEDTSTPREQFNIMATELWFAAAKLFEFDVIRIGKGVDLKVFAELAARQGGMAPGLGKKLMTESKSDFKSRTGMDSPDLADATLIMISVARWTTPNLIPRAKDTPAAKPQRDVMAWEGFNQQFGAATMRGMSAPGELADLLKD